jgi:hypothetical protein
VTPPKGPPVPGSSQLELALEAADRRDDAAGGMVVTRALRSHRSCNRTLEKVRYVLRYFPELSDKRIKVGLTRAASGMAVAGGCEIWLNPFRTPYHTISHELVHLLQRSGTDIPQGERSCDVYSLARHWTLNDVTPNYVQVPPQLVEVDGTLAPRSARIVYDAALEALAQKKNGLRRYITYFEESLRRTAVTLPPPPVSTTR